jgi:hypothetical protein
VKKKCLFLGLLMLLTVSCVVDRLNNVLSNGVDNMATPSWDVKFDVPIGEVKAQLSKIGEVKSMLEGLKFSNDEKVDGGEDALIHVKINDMTLDSSLFTVDKNVSEALGGKPVLTWPLPIGRVDSPKTDDTSIPVIKLDLDSDGSQDLMLSSLKSNDGSLKIKVKMELQELSGEWRDATKDDFFDEEGNPYIAIEDVQVGEEKYAIQVGTGKFSFKTGDYQDGYLVFETANFLNDYNNPIQPLGVWLWDETKHDWSCEADGETHKLSKTEFEYRVSIPKGALQIRGKSFDIVENILFEKDKEEAKKSVRSRSVSRSGSVLTDEKIKAKIAGAKGDVKVLESLLTEDGVTLEKVAAVYEGDLDKVLTDSGCEIVDIMKSEVIASDENIKVLGNPESGFGKYNLDGKTLADIENAGNLKDLADFCKFHDKNAIQAIKFTFKVEVDLGDGFLITAEVIDDYEMAVDVDSSLPFSMIGKVLENASLDTYITHNFGCEMKIKEPKIANTTVKIDGLEKVGDDGFYLIPKDSCHMQLVLDEMPKEDGGMAFSMLVPKDTEVDIALNPTEENDLWIKMVLGANGTLKFDMDNFTGMMEGE